MPARKYQKCTLMWTNNSILIDTRARRSLISARARSGISQNSGPAKQPAACQKLRSLAAKRPSARPLRQLAAAAASGPPKRPFISMQPSGSERRRLLGGAIVSAGALCGGIVLLAARRSLTQVPPRSSQRIPPTWLTLCPSSSPALILIPILTPILTPILIPIPIPILIPTASSIPQPSFRFGRFRR